MQMISAIENAMVAAIKSAATAFRVDSIESYGGQLDDDALEGGRRLPAIWGGVAGGGKPVRVDTGRTKWRFKATFTVFCAQRNLTNNQALRQGDARNPGVYALLQLAVTSLLHKDLGLEIKELEPGTLRTVTSMVVGRDAVMVYAINWHTEWV